MNQMVRTGKQLGAYIQDARARKGVSQQQLAEMIGTAQTIGDIF